MAAGRKEYELLLKLKAALGGNFNSTFSTAMNTTKQLQNSLQSIKKVQSDISAYKKTETAIATQKKTVQELTQKHVDLQKKLTDTADREKELKKALEKSKKATGAETEEYKRLETELKKTQDEKEKLTNQIHSNEAATDKATRKIGEEEKKLADLSKQLQTAGIDTNKLTQENAKLEQAYERVKKSQEDYARVSQKIEENKAAISATKTELVKTTAAITASGAAFYKAFISPAAEFRSEMSNLGAITGATNDEINQMSAGMREISKITGTPLMELAKNAKMVAEAGGDVNLMMAQMTHGTNLAGATQSDMATTLDFLGSQMKTFNIAAEQTKGVADSFAYVTTLANLELSQLGESFVNVGGSAVQAGMDINGVNAFLVSFSNAGLKGGAAGTSLNAVLRNLSTPTKKAADALKELKVDLYDSTGASRDMFDIMADLENKLGGMTDKQRNHYQNIIFDTVAQKGWNMIAAEGIDTIIELRDEIEDSADAYDGLGQAAGMAGKQQNDLTGDMAKAKTAWHDVSITIGDLFIPYARTAVQQVTEIINKIGDFAKENPALIKTLVGVAGGLGVVKVGALTSKLGFLEAKGGILEVAKSFLGFKANAADMAASALTSGEKVAGFGGKLMQYFSGVKNSISGVGGSIDNLAGGKLSGLFSKIGGGLQSGILKPLGEIGGKITGTLGGAGNKITSFFGDIGSKVANGPLGKIGGVFKSMGNAAGSVLGGPLKGLGSMFSGLFGKAMPIIMILSALSILFLKLSGEDVSSFIEPLKQAFEDIKPVLQNVMEQFKELGKQLLPVLMETVKKLAPLLGQIVTAILPIVLEVIQQLVPLLIQIIGTVLPVILDIIGQLAPLLTEVITAILPVVLTLIQELLPVIIQFAKDVLPIILSVLEALMPVIKTLIEAVLPVLKTIIEALTPVIKELASILSGVLGGALKSITAIVENVKTIFQGLSDFITGVFTGNWSQAWEGIKTIFGGVFGALVELAKAPIRTVVTVINGVIGGLNKLTIPEWVPGLGGMGINIPLIPTFYKGTDYTPDTFIAGDVNGKGGELVTNARGRKVFTAAQTNAIFDNINRAKAINSVTPAPAVWRGASGGQTFTMQCSTTIHVDGNKPGDLEEKLKQNNESLLEMIKAFLRQQREDERRMQYA